MEAVDGKANILTAETRRESYGKPKRHHRAVPLQNAERKGDTMKNTNDRRSNITERTESAGQSAYPGQGSVSTTSSLPSVTPEASEARPASHLWRKRLLVAGIIVGLAVIGYHYLRPGWSRLSTRFPPMTPMSMAT